MRVLALGCTHFPFQHKHTFDFLEHVRDEHSPDMIVHVGDIVDIHNPSRHEPDPDGHSPGREFDIARHVIKTFFQLFPEGILCESNHDERYKKAAYRARIPKELVKDAREAYNFPSGWEFVDSAVVEGVRYQHEPHCGGEQVYTNVPKNNMMSTVFGHLHTKFGAVYFANRDKLVFGAATGCLVDKDSYAMQYGKKYKDKPVLGCLIVDDGSIVTPIPMILDSSGDWIGK